MIRRSLCIGIMLTASAFTAHARETCNPDSFSNPDLVICGQQSFEKVDALLNEQYKKALGSLAPAEQLQLKDVQKKWVRFKEGFCEEIYQGTFPGAEAPIDRLGCLVQTTNARLGELVALQTGLPLDGFYKAATALAGQNREKGLATSMERLGGADFDDPLWKQYADGHCEMAVQLFREDFANCIVRMRFQLPLNR